MNIGLLIIGGFLIIAVVIIVRRGKGKKLSAEFHERCKNPAKIFIQLNSGGMINVRHVNGSIPIYANVGQLKQAIHVEPGKCVLNTKYMKQGLAVSYETDFTDLEVVTEPNKEYYLGYDWKNNTFTFDEKTD